jgi:tight adherence protein B
MMPHGMEYSLYIVAFIACAVFVYHFLLFSKSRFIRFRRHFVGQTAKDLDLLYSEMEAEKFWVFTLLSMVVFGLLGLFLEVNFFTMIMLLTIGFVVPRLVITILRKKRMAKFNDQLVETVELIANSLRVGFNLHQSLKMVVEEMAPPISQEFNLVLKENLLGTPLHQALEKMNKRLNNEDFNIVVTAVTISQTVGGDLSSIFSRIAETIRSRNHSNKRMESLTAQGKLQGIILSCLPFIVFTILYIWDKTYVMPLLTTKEGWTLLTIALALEAIGIFFIVKIVNPDV